MAITSILLLENSMDRGAWQATVRGAPKCWTRLSTHTHSHCDTCVSNQHLVHLKFFQWFMSIIPYKKEKRKETWQPSYGDQAKLEMAVRLFHLNGHFSALRFLDLSVAFD